MFISGAGETELLVVMCRTGEAGPKGISAIAIPANTTGVSYGKAEDKMGWNSQPTAQVIFENCKVPIKNLIGKEVLINQVGCYGINLGKIDFYLSEDNIKEKSSSFKI